jgi:hypothetical protein
MQELCSRKLLGIQKVSVKLEMNKTDIKNSEEVVVNGRAESRWLKHGKVHVQQLLSWLLIAN